MLAGLMYEDALSLFVHLDHSNGLFPDDVLEILDDLGLPTHDVSTLPKRQPALVAVDWKEEGFSGHYLVWDPRRGQFLDPLHGLVGRRDLLRLCRIEHIWTVGERNMRNLVKARVAKALAKELFEPFGPVSVGLYKMPGRFQIEVRFASEPDGGAWKIMAVRGVPVHIEVVGATKAQEQ